MELQWESHKQTLKRLYLEEGKTKDEAAKEMELLFGFRASGREYERHFKKWKFRKNLKPQEWESVGRRVDKRKRDEGKESELRIDGVLVPQRRLQRELARHSESVFNRFKRAQLKHRSPTPEGLCISTPASKPELFYNIAAGRTTYNFMEDQIEVVDYSDEYNMSTSLLTFIKEGKEHLVQWSLAYGANANAWDEKERSSALSVAIRNDRLHIAHILLDHGANINGEGVGNEISTRYPKIPLLIAVKTGSTGAVKLLLERGADVNTETLLGTTPLLLAVQTRSFDIVNLLLDKGARTEVCDFLEATPLDCAIMSGDIAISKLLLDFGADIETLHREITSVTPLQIVAYYGSVEMATLFIEKGADVNACPVATALHFAVDCEDIEMVSLLLENGAKDVTASEPPLKIFSTGIQSVLSSMVGATALMVAARKPEPTSLKLVRRLVAAGLDTNTAPAYSYPNSALTAALEAGNYHVAQHLVNKGALPSIPLRRSYCSFQAVASIAHHAAEQGDMWILQQIVRAGIDMIALDSRGRSPVARAIESDCVNEDAKIEVVAFLIENGATITVRDSGRYTSIAIREHFWKLAKILLNYGAAWTCSELKTAAGFRQYELVEKMLQTSPSSPCLGHVAIYEAVVNDDIPMIYLLNHLGVQFCMPCCIGAVRLSCHDTKLATLGALLHVGAPVNTPQSAKDWRLNCCEERYEKSKVPYDLDGYECGWPGSPLQVAAKAGQNSVVQLLLARGARISEYFEKRSFSLWNDKWHFVSTLYLAMYGGLDTMRLLVQAGADVNQPAVVNATQRTFLQVAVEHGDEKMVGFLVRQANTNVNVPAARYAGITALQAASIKGFIRIASTLLEAGADVNAPRAETHGRTALEGAAEWGRIDMIQLLLNYGADVESAEFGAEQYQRAVQLAERNGYNAAARMLKRYHANLR